MIVILNGPLGVGKTDTAWHIVERLERAAVLDCDYIGSNVSFFDHRSDDSFEATLGSLRALATYQRDQMDITDFIVSGVFESNEQLSRAIAVLSEISHPVFCFALIANASTIRKRVLKRGNSVAKELRRAYELLSIFEATDGLGERIDTTALSVTETASQLLERIQLLRT